MTEPYGAVKAALLQAIASDPPEEPVAVTGGADKFFPTEEADAQGILGQVGGTATIVVVPDGFPLGPASSGNAAVTVLKPLTQNMLHNACDAHADDFPGIDVAKVKARIKDRTIVLKQQVMQGDALRRAGTIWHEYGHVQFGAAESGSVFTFELESIRDQFSPEVAADYAKTVRTLQYLRTTAKEPGRAELMALLTTLVGDE